MPIDKTYAKKVYDSLRDDVEGFDKDEATFYKLIETDKNYLKNVHLTLKDVYGDDFDKDEAMFESALGLKKKEPTTPPLSFGYKTATEATSNAGLPKQETISQSPLKSTAKSTLPAVQKPKTNLDYLSNINNLYKEKVATSQGRVDTKKQLLQLEPQLTEAYKQIEQLNSVYADTQQPLEARKQAAKDIELLQQQIAPIYSQYTELSNQYNELVNTDKRIIGDLNKTEQERQLALDKNYSFAKGLIEDTGNKFVETAAGIGGIFNTLGLSGDPESPELDQEEVKAQTRQNLQKMRDFGQSLITQEAPKEWQNVFEGKFSPKKLAYLTSQAVSSTIPTVAAGILTGGAGISSITGGQVLGASAAGSALAGAGLGFNESKDIFKEAGLNEEQSDWAALGLAPIIGALESYGADDVVKVLKTPIIQSKVAQELVKNIAGKKVTKELLFNEARKSLGKVLVNNTGEVFSTGLKEAGTEMAQGQVQEIAKQAVQEYTGVNPDDDMEASDYIIQQLKQRAEEGLGGFLGGTTLQAAGKTISGALNGFKANFSPSVYAQVKEFADPDKFAEFQQDLQDDISEGKINEQEAEQTLQLVEAIKQADTLIPDAVQDVNKRTEAVNLLVEKQALEAQIEGKDKALSEPITKRINEINESLKGISNEEEATTQVQEPIETEVGVLNEQGTPQAVEVLKAPTPEQKLSDIQNGNVVTFEYNSKNEIPDVLKDKISSVATTNGVTTYRVSIAKSEADFLLQENIEPPVVEQTTTDVGGVEAPNVSMGLEIPTKVVGDTVNEDLKIKVYHGGGVKSEKDMWEGVPLFVSKDKSQAQEYTKGNNGEVVEFLLDNKKIATEDDAREIISKLGLQPKQEGWSTDELNLFELIDSAFDTAFSDEDIERLFKELEGKGYEGIEFTDTNLKTLKQDIQNIVVFNPKKTFKSVSEIETTKTEQTPTETKEVVSESVSEKPTKAERKAIAAAPIDELANKAKDFANKYLAAKGIEGAKKASFGDQNKVIDIIAETVKTLVNAGIEIDEAIKDVRAYFENEYDTSDLKDFEIKQAIARDELSDYAKEKGFTSYRNAVFAVNKYVREVGKEDVITKEDIDKAKEAKDKGEEREVTTQKLSGRNKSYEEKRVPVSEKYREAVNQKKVYYESEGIQAYANEAIEYLSQFGDSISGLDTAYVDMVKVYNDNPYYKAYNSIAIELLSDRLFAEGEKSYLNGDNDLANRLFEKSDTLRVMAFNAARKAGQYNAALAIFSSSQNPDAFLMFVNKEIEKETEQIKKVKQPKIDQEVKEFKSKVNKAKQDAAKEAVKSSPKKTALQSPKFSKLKERGVKRQKEALAKLKKLGFLGSNGLNNEAIEAIGELIVSQLEIGIYKAANIIQKIRSITSGNVNEEHIKEAYDKYKIKYEGKQYNLTELSELLEKKDNAEQIKLNSEKFAEEKAKQELKVGKALSLSELLERDLLADETSENIAKNIQNEFGLSEKEANDIAKKFYDKYKSLLKEKIDKALATSLGIKNVKEIERRESAGEIKPYEKTLGGKIVAEVLGGALDGSTTIQDAFATKYGIPTMSATVRDNIRLLAKRAKSATTALGLRTANRNLISYIQENIPTSSSGVLKTAYYVSLLSGVSTAAVNTWGNINTLLNQSVGENFVQSIMEAVKGNPSNLIATANGKAKALAAITNMNRALIAFTDIMKRGGGENKYYNLNQKAISEFDSERLIAKKDDFKNMGLKDLAKSLAKLYYTIPSIINRNLSASDEAFYSLNYNVEATREIRKKLYKETGLRGKELETEVFKAVYGTKEVVLEASKQAEQELVNIGMTPSKNKRLLKRITQEIISKKLDKNVQETAEKIAAENTYRGELRGAMGYIGTVVPQITLITPFVNTVVKIAEKHMNYIPIYGIFRTTGLGLTDNLRQIKSINDYFERKGIQRGKREGELLNKQIAQVILSHALWGTLWALSYVNWHDDDDDKDKPFVEASGGYVGMNYQTQKKAQELMPEYTLRIGDFKVNYKNNPLLAMIALPIAARMDMERVGKTQEEILERMTTYSFALGTYLYDAVPIKNIQEFFASLSKTTDEFKDVDPEQLAKEVVKSFAMIPANLVAPNTYKQMFDFFNPQKYDTNDYKDAIWKALNMEKIGGLVPTHDYWGRPVKMYPGETFLPIQYLLSEDSDDDVTEWAIKKQISLPSLNRKTLVLDLIEQKSYTQKEWDKKQLEKDKEFFSDEMESIVGDLNYKVLSYQEWAEMDAHVRQNVYKIIERNLTSVTEKDEVLTALELITEPFDQMTSKKANRIVDELFEIERLNYIRDNYLTKE